MTSVFSNQICESTCWKLEDNQVLNTPIDTFNLLHELPKLMVFLYLSHENLEQIKIWNDPNFHEDSSRKLERYNFSRNKLERYKSSQMCV